MASITNDCIKIEGITEKYLLLDFQMKVEPNDHGHAKLHIRMVEEEKGENLLKGMEDKLITVKSTAKDNTGILFKGYLESCTVSPQLDGETVEIGLVTATIKADRERESISFQKKEMQYGEIIEKAAAKSSGICTYLDEKIKSTEIKKPVIQYGETSWEFVKRISSRYRLPVVPDETADKPTFTIGLKEEGTAPERGFFPKEYKDFIRTGAYIRRKLRDENSNVIMKDYTGMEVRSFNTYKIGMKAAYHGKNMVICSKRAETEGAQIVFTYVLGSGELYSPEKTYNHRLHGRCLEGKVVKCENERVKMQLDIDEDSGNEKPEQELYWFNWQPETGNLMYCMPEKDTVVSLYVGDTDEGNAVVINALRKDKGKDIDDPDKRYLTTVDKKRMLIKKKEIGFSMEDKDDGNTNFSLSDEKGNLFKTNKKMVIQADGEIHMTGNKVSIIAQKELELVNDTTNVQIKKKINIKGKMTYLGYGVTVPEQQGESDKLQTNNKNSANAYESDLERMSQGVMEGYFKENKGQLSREDKESLVKTLIMLHEMTDVSKRKNNLPPEKAEFIKDNPGMYYKKSSNRYGIIYAWEKDDTVPSTRRMEVMKKGERFDRVGPETGKCVGKVSKDGKCAEIEERSIPYYFSGDDIVSEPSYHRYEALQDFTRENMENAIQESLFYSDEQKKDMLDQLEQYYENNKSKYGEGDGLTTGEIARMFGKKGGGMQHDMPFNMVELQDLGMISKV